MPDDRLQTAGDDAQVHAWLLINQEGGAPPRAIPLQKPAVRLGRAEGLDIVFPSTPANRVVSRMHALLERVDGEFWISELSECPNGTFVNGSKIDGRTQLRSGASIQLGRSGPILEFHVGSRPPLVDLATRRAPGGCVTFLQGGSDASRSDGTACSGESFRLSVTDDLVMGRGEDCHVRLHPTRDTGVSKRHAKISHVRGCFHLIDLGSRGGTWIQDRDSKEFHTVGEIVVLRDGDVFALGPPSPETPILQFSADAVEEARFEGTMITSSDAIEALSASFSGEMSAVRWFALEGREVVLGRSRECEVRLDDPTVSQLHARLVKREARWEISDLGARNGIHVNGVRVRSRILAEGDLLTVGQTVLRMQQNRLELLEGRRRETLVALDLTWRPGGGPLAAGTPPGARVVGLQPLSMSLHAGEMVGLLGPSGAGKSTLMKLFTGLTRPADGAIKVIGRDLLSDRAAAMEALGFVPQDDILHSDLTVAETLEYAAKLRLPADTGDQERTQRVGVVLEQVEMTDHAHKLVRMLSGGQRKRVSVGLELISDPALLFLDEPTTGLEPSLELKLMTMLKGLAHKGRTVLVTTHVLQSAALFDRIVVMYDMALVFLGSPARAKDFFAIDRLEDLYSHLGQRSADAWRTKFEQVRAGIGSRRPAAAAPAGDAAAGETQDRPSSGGTLGQTLTLAERYVRMAVRSKASLAWVLVGLPSCIAAGICAALDQKSHLLLMTVLSGFWLACSYAGKELVKERAIYARERMAGMTREAYLLSKLPFLIAVALVQSLLIHWVVTWHSGYATDPGTGIAAVTLTSLCGMMAGLAISAFARSLDMAQNLVPLIVVSQVLFSGAFGKTQDASAIVSAVSPVYWGFDLLKQANGAKEADRDAPRSTGEGPRAAATTVRAPATAGPHGVAPALPAGASAFPPGPAAGAQAFPPAAPVDLDRVVKDKLQSALESEKQSVHPNRWGARRLDVEVLAGLLTVLLGLAWAGLVHTDARER